MIEADLWIVIVGNILLFCIAPVLIGLFVKCWWNVKRTKGNMVAEIWEPSGFVTRELVKPDPTGATVTVDNLVYRLPKEKEFSDKEKKKEKENPEHHTYPRRRWYYMQNRPLPPIPLRIEAWERDNPEPVRPFYGRITEDGKFDDSQLTVTSTEWQAQKSVIQATGIAMSVQEREAREKEWARAMANLPNKMIVYIGIGIAALGSVICAIMVYQMAMG